MLSAVHVGFRYAIRPMNYPKVYPKQVTKQSEADIGSSLFSGGSGEEIAHSQIDDTRHSLPQLRLVINVWIANRFRNLHLGLM